MYFHPKDEYIYYRGDCDIKQRLTDRSASHFGRFAPQIRPMGCAICKNRKIEIISLFFELLEELISGDIRMLKKKLIYLEILASLLLYGCSPSVK